eukprot:TRINITY_DN7670_c0_g1_i1.p1 TRINITY_DN7670_c0_g1~~TRINITY_DN7670_c0_g1_i1.p1  ORF type:complete len:268 (-),score=64.50 TRINITY_DN7670_c0_g1_i1:184-987(-)
MSGARVTQRRPDAHQVRLNWDRKQRAAAAKQIDKITELAEMKVLKINHSYQDHPPVPFKMPLKRGLDRDTAERVVRGYKEVSEYLHRLANEPSVGLHHVTDHVRRNVNVLAELKKTLKIQGKKLDDMSYDIDSAILVLRPLHEINTFSSILHLVKEANQRIQMINNGVPYEENQYQSDEEILDIPPNAEHDTNNETTTEEYTDVIVTDDKIDIETIPQDIPSNLSSEQEFSSSYSTSASPTSGETNFGVPNRKRKKKAKRIEHKTFQ